LSENVLPKNTAAPNTETMPIKLLPNSFVTECYRIDTKLFLTKIIVVLVAPKTPISWTPYRKMHYPDKKRMPNTTECSACAENENTTKWVSHALYICFAKDAKQAVYAYIHTMQEHE